VQTLRHTIGKRISRLVLVAIFASVLSAATLHIVFQVMRDIDTRKQSMTATAYALASAAGDATANQDSAAAASALSAVSRIPDLDVAIISLDDGSVLASMGQTTYLTRDLIVDRDSWLSMLLKGKLPVAVEIVKGADRKGTLTIIADISSLRLHLAESILVILAAAMFTSLLGVIAAKPLQQRIVGPLTQLTKTIQTLRSSRDYATVLEDDNTPDETGVLVKAFNGLMSDIRFRDRALKQLAYNDPLTGLPNRVSFQRDLSDWLERPFEKPAGAVVLLNIHGFRSMNDTFSHTIGDGILLSVAAGLKSALAHHAVLARYGGDEFAILLPDAANESDVAMAVSRITTKFGSPVKIGALDLHVTLTSGAVTIFDRSAEAATTDEILRHADLALAEAKLLTPGTLQVFSSPMAEKVHRDTELKQALRQACDKSEFIIHYQCQFDLQTNSVSGFEALVRWKHPERGFISPAVFIPLAEQLGLVGIIGEWVLLESCKQAVAWRRNTRSERVMSVNVSPAQILAAGFVEKVRMALRKSGLPPHLLCLELTESMFLGAKFAETVTILEALAKDGVKLALDDFGTGYSSLSYISKLPFHSIKIDRAFVADAHATERKSAMLKSIVDMVHTLEMESVAEGAESPDEVRLLQSLGVKKVQGYVFARPLPADDALLRANQIEAQNRRLSA
jgi:diguanylate cyclase (GGDEF)-like protein